MKQAAPATALFAIIAIACSDPAPAGPTAAELEAQATARALTQELLRAEAPVDPAPEPEEPEAEPEALAALRNFAGFSSDGSRFAYGSGSATAAGASCLIWVTTPGSDSAEILTSVYEESDVAAAQQALEDFRRGQPAPPADVTMEAALTANPPTVTLHRGEASATRTIERYPFPPTDVGRLWGVSADGSHAVIEVHGPQVDGLLTRAGPGTVRFFRVVPMP